MLYIFVKSNFELNHFENRTKAMGRLDTSLRIKKNVNSRSGEVKKERRETAERKINDEIKELRVER